MGLLLKPILHFGVCCFVVYLNAETYMSSVFDLITIGNTNDECGGDLGF